MGTFRRFQFGENEIVVLSDGSTVFPSAFLMVGVDEKQRVQACEKWGLNPEAVDSNTNCIYINGASGSILFDTGAGPTMPCCGTLPESINAAGINPASIEKVIHTHLHLDHLGWNVTDAGAPMFPNAEYCVGATEYAFWSDEKTHESLERSELWNLPEFEPAMSAVVRSNVLALEDRLRVIPDDGEPAPGVRGVPAFGHTPGHLAFEVDLGRETLFVTGDLVLSPFHLDRGDWYPAVDLDPQTAIQSRNRVFDRAAERGALVSGYHLPFPGLGRVSNTDTGWEWAEYQEK
jgi:glyoxylase-like metal-dependent hydrolase (beta-lactamase superfamily II)